MKGKTQKYYDKNPAARKVKAATDKKVNSRPSQIKKRSESNQKRREAKAKGHNISGKDFDHAVGKFVKMKTNRGRNGEGNR